MHLSNVQQLQVDARVYYAILAVVVRSKRLPFRLSNMCTPSKSRRDTLSRSMILKKIVLDHAAYIPKNVNMM